MAFQLQSAVPPPPAAPAPNIVPNQQVMRVEPPPSAAPATKSASSPDAVVSAPSVADQPTLLNQPKQAVAPPSGPMPGGKAAGVLGGALGLVSVFAQRKARAEAKKAQTAIMQVTGQNATWDAVAKQWQQYQLEHPGEDFSANSKDPQVQMLRHAVTSAWNDRVNAYAQYTMPDVAAAQAAAETDPKAAQKLQDKHKKSMLEALKGFVEGKITPETPQLILQSQLNQMRAIKDPTTLIPPPSPKDVLAYSKDQDQLKAQQAQQQLGDLYASLPPDQSQWTQANRDRVAQLRNQVSAYGTGKPAQESLEQEKADVARKFTSGQTLTPQEMQFIGITPKPNTGENVTLRGPGGQNEAWHVTYGPDGNVVNRVKVGTAPPTAVEQEVAKRQAEIAEIQRAHPGMSYAQAMDYSYGRKGYDQQETPQDKVSNAIAQAMSASMPASSDPAKDPSWMPFVMTGTDQDGNPIYMLRQANGVVNRDGALAPTKAGQTADYALNSQPVGNGNNPAYTAGEAIYPGGIPVAQISTYEQMFRKQLQSALKRNGVPQPDIDRIMGRPLYMQGTGVQPPSSSATKAAPPPTVPSSITDQQVQSFMASPGGKGMSAQQARAALEAAAKGGQ